MKRIINGRSYNTDTATLVARSWWQDWEQNDAEIRSDLYLTRGGAFFLVHTGPADADIRTIFEPIEREAVDKWLTTGEVELLDATVFAEPDEAAAEREPEATLYIRVPRSLKDRIEAAAEDDELSVNAWVMRCVERCCAAPAKAADALGVAHYIATSINAWPDGYTAEQYREALHEIAEGIEAAWEYLDLPRVKGVDLREDVVLHASEAASRAHITRHWEPYRHESRNA